MQSINTIVQHYYPIITRLARFIIKNDTAAAGIPANVFSQLQQSLPDIHSKKQLRKYLITATRLACHAWLHQQALLMNANNKNFNNESSPTSSSILSPEPVEGSKDGEGLGSDD